MATDTQDLINDLDPNSGMYGGSTATEPGYSQEGTATEIDRAMRQNLKRSKVGCTTKSGMRVG